jgi:hypothetical protein
MSEKSFILSHQQHMTTTTTAIMPRSVLGRFVDTLTEKFDALAMFVSKWTF